jgi:predicted neuraminidase
MKPTLLLLLCGFLLATQAGASGQRRAAVIYESELIFPLEHWHNHSSSVVECPNGDLLVCWFHGSGERTADDVKIEGARLKRGSKHWSSRFTMADTFGYPDTNCTMFIDPSERLWLIWPTILANEWHTALLKYRVSSDYQRQAGPPRWELNDVLHVTAGPEFEQTVARALADFEPSIKEMTEPRRQLARDWVERTKKNAADKLFRRLGWMTRAHPFVLDGKRLIVPLYSDGFSFSLMALSDDWGKTWRTSTPLVGAGNIQPSIVKRADGRLLALMRDNGPAPKRLHMSESTDGGLTWGPVTDSEIPNPGSGAEIISLRNGHWVLIYNDTEINRNSLAVAISDDEGKTWRWKRHLEYDPPGPQAGAYHYPSIIQARDGSLHASYSYHLNRRDLPLDSQGKPARKTIKHVRFNEEWIMQGDGAAR